MGGSVSRFRRSSHLRTNRYGTTFRVREHSVDRDHWELRAEPVEAQAFEAGNSGSLLVPNARCPVCGDTVWFFRSKHDGRVFFDDVWPTWAKHPCTDNGRTVYALTPDETAAIEPLDLPEVEVFPRADGMIIGLRFDDGGVEYVKGEIPKGESFFPAASVDRDGRGRITEISLQSTALSPCTIRVTPCDPPKAIEPRDRLAYANSLYSRLLQYGRTLPGLTERKFAVHPTIGPFVAGKIGWSRVVVIPLLLDHCRDGLEPFEANLNGVQVAVAFVKEAALTILKLLARQDGEAAPLAAHHVIFVWEGTLTDTDDAWYDGTKLTERDGIFDFDIFWPFRNREVLRLRIESILADDLINGQRPVLKKGNAVVQMLIEHENHWVERYWRDTGEGQMKQVLDLATRLGLRDTLQALHSELLRQGWGILYAYRTSADFEFGGGDRRMLQYEPTEVKQAKNQNARVMRILFSMSSHEEGLAVLLDADEEDRVVGKRLMWIRDASGVKEFIYRSVQAFK